jgi:quinol-cytochrome oxidoreductase complex cytochrome b subunit
MSKFEKRLIVAALVFVAIYLGAAAVTIHTRITEGDTIERLESPDLSPAEGQLLIAELFLPFMILFTLAICFILVRKQRIKKLLEMEREEETEEDVEREIE